MKFTCTVLLIGLILLPLTGNAFSSGPIDGQVLEYDTGRPVASATVVARWIGTWPSIAHSQQFCAHAESAISDSNGIYHMNSWIQLAPLIPSLLGAGRTLDAYKAGYETTDAPLAFVGRPDGTWIVYGRGGAGDGRVFRDMESARQATHPENVYLRAFAGTPDERFEFLRYRVFGGMSCSGAGASERNLYPLVKAAFQEATVLAKSEKQIESLRIMRDSAAYTWLARPSDTPGITDPMALVPEDIRRDLGGAELDPVVRRVIRYGSGQTTTIAVPQPPRK